MPIPLDSTPIHIFVEERAESALFYHHGHTLEQMQLDFGSTLSKVMNILFFSLSFSSKLDTLLRYQTTRADLKGRIYSAPSPQPGSDVPPQPNQDEALPPFVWSLFYSPYANSPPCKSNSSSLLSIHDIFLAFIYHDLIMEFSNPFCYRNILFKTLFTHFYLPPFFFLDLPNLLWLQEKLKGNAEKYSPLRLDIFKILMQMDKDTFWRMPSKIQKKKRSILSKCRKTVENLYYANVAEFQQVKKLLKEPYVRTDIIDLILNDFAMPTKQGRNADGTLSTNTTQTISAISSNASQSIQAGFFHPSYKFISTFKLASGNIPEEAMRFHFDLFFPSHLKLSISGYTTAESAGKLYTVRFSLFFYFSPLHQPNPLPLSLSPSPVRHSIYSLNSWIPLLAVPFDYPKITINSNSLRSESVFHFFFFGF